LQLADYHYQKALARNPWSPQVLASYGNFLMSTNACKAIAPLEKAVSLDFYFSLSHFDLANSYLSCGPREQAVAEAAVAILTAPSTAYASRWRTNPEFLAAVLEQSLRWLESWDSEGSTAIDREQLRRLTDFVRRARATPEAPSHTMVILSGKFADQPDSDPFAYIFQRRTPAFETTEIEVGGFNSETRAPEGIGHVRCLRSLLYGELDLAYRNHKLDDLMCSLRAARLTAR
jgi:tetratricopeptide (TPR) repeat protein